MVILLRVVVQLVQLIIERMCWMGCPAVADFADNIPEPVLGDEAGRIRRTSIRLQDDAHFADDVEHVAGARGEEGL